MSDSQVLAIINHLEKGGALTPKKAAELLGVERFGARILDIKQRYPSFKLKSRWVKAPNRRGEMTRFKEYYKG